MTTFNLMAVTRRVGTRNQLFLQLIFRLTKVSRAETHHILQHDGFRFALPILRKSFTQNSNASPLLLNNIVLALSRLVLMGVVVTSRQGNAILSLPPASVSERLAYLS